MVDKFLVYSEDLNENHSAMGRPVPFPGSFQANGGYTPFFAVNAPPGKSIGGLYVEATATATATAGASAIAGSDVLDLVVGGYNISDSPNADARCRTVTRLGVEEAERLLFAPSNSAQYKYPRATASSITAANLTPAYVVPFIIPCGESTDAVQVAFKLPTVAASFSASVTSISVQYVVYPIPSVSPATIAFVESPLPQYGANAVVPLEQYQPTNISPDLVDFVGSTAATFTNIAGYDTTGNEQFNMLTTTAIQSAQYGWPGVSDSTASCFVNMGGSRASRLAVNLAVTASLDVLWIQVADVPTAGPTEGHDVTPTTPATSKQGQSVNGTVASVPSKAMNVSPPMRNGFSGQGGNPFVRRVA
jgi:hypothetical protein